MKSATVKVFVVALAVVLCQAMAFADIVPYAGSTTGAFSAGTPTDLKFAGTNFSGSTQDGIGCFLLGTCGWSLGINLGKFNLSNPGFRKPDVYDNKTFTLTVDFTAPDQVAGGDKLFTANLSGTIHWIDLGNPMTIDFGGATQHITFGPGTNGVGSFDFEVENPFILLDDSPTLYGEILNAQAGPNPPAVPEPAAIVLFGTMVLGIGLWRKARNIVRS
jgi:hypothetical protein